MMKWIRWQGLLAFVVVVGAIVAFWLLFIDGIVGGLIEKTGTAMVGAEVNVKADVKLFPLGLTLEQLQVTNPQAPDRNSMECSRIALNLDSLNLLRSKVIINEMAMEGLRFDTERKSRGRVVEKPAEEKRPEEKKSSLAFSMEKPDVNEILKTEKLESMQLIETTKADLKKKEADWQKRVEEMPDKAKLDGYRERIEKIRKAKRDLRSLADQLSAAKDLRRDLESDLDLVKQSRVAFTKDLSSAKALFEQAQQAPMDDVRRLRDKYSISPDGLSNMTQVLFGDEISSWVRTGLLWYNRLQPVVERAKAARAEKKGVVAVKPMRGKGVDVRFKEYRPLPDFLIDRTAVSAETTAGLLSGTIRNITPDQNILGVPLTYTFKGEKLTAARSLAITGALNHVRPARPEDTARVVVQAFKLRNLVLSSGKDLPVSLQDALVDFDLNGVYTQAMKARFTANVSSAKMNVGGEGSHNLFVTSIRSALSKVDRFTITADMTGTLENYTMKINSDLDNILKNAVGSVVKEQSAKLEQQLKAAVQGKTGVQLKDLQGTYGALTQKGNRLEAVQNQLNTMLQEALKSSGGGRLKLP